MDITSSTSPSTSNKSNASNTSNDWSLEDNTSFETMYTLNDNESIITDPNINILELPFHITNNSKAVKTMQYYYDKFRQVRWYRHQPFNNYLNEIKELENKYFNVKYYSDIALNTLNTKHLLDIKFKITEHIKQLN
jgi:hypothetical protein